MVDFLVKGLNNSCFATPEEGEAICKMEKGENGINNITPSSKKHDIVLLYQSNEDLGFSFNYNSIFVFTPKEEIGKDFLVKWIVKWIDKQTDIYQYKIKEDRTTGKYALYGLLADDLDLLDLQIIVNSIMKIAEKAHFFYKGDMEGIIYHTIFAKSITGKESRQLKQEIINSRINNESVLKEEDIFDLS